MLLIEKLVSLLFNNEVTIIGDGTKNPAVITSDKLYDHDFLFVKWSWNLLANSSVKSIKETRKPLGSKLMNMKKQTNSFRPCNPNFNSDCW